MIKFIAVALLASLSSGAHAANPARLNLKLTVLPIITQPVILKETSLKLTSSMKLDAPVMTSEQLTVLIATLPELPKGFNPPLDDEGHTAGIFVPVDPKGPLPTLSAAKKLPFQEKVRLPGPKLYVHNADHLFDNRRVTVLDEADLVPSL